ncbi:MAG TPA: phosphopentomutase [Miltoncostaeaceae bacterium]|nr:phosphopentomutase [Miltoncostaeaceae bacterium]
MSRVIVLVMDGVGAGAAVDADRYGDAGSDTLGNTARAVGGLRLPTLERLGLGCVLPLAGVAEVRRPEALIGRLAERSAGKDTTTGHWELMGLRTDQPFRTYPEGFPDDVMEAFAAATGRGWLCNRPASGTEVIDRFGAEHMRTGALIVYTSADSVFQIAAHEGVVPLEELYDDCRAARAILTGEHAVSRVIARPFVGEPGSFERTRNRKDFSVEPHGPTALDRLTEAGVPVEGVGKIKQIFAGRGVGGEHLMRDNHDGMEISTRLLGEVGHGLVFANLIDFDMLYGHRNDARGFADCLEEFDADLGPLMGAMRDGDLLVVTADHGNDPTTPSTDHSREWVPLVAWEPGRDPAGGRWVGEFGDVGQTALARLAPEADRDGLSGRPVAALA